MRVGHREWTDAELGFIQDHDNWSRSQIAKALGRTPESVGSKRRKMRSGWIPKKNPFWSVPEDEFLIANPRMSAKDAAASLVGRTVESVGHRRNKLREKGLIGLSVGRNWSPHVIGSRPLLAKTCLDCGLLLQEKWFAANQHGSRSRRCYRCRDAISVRKHGRPETEKRLRQSRKSLARLQQLTRSRASQHGQPWTESDFAILKDPDMTALQKALILRRTYAATRAACKANGFKSHVGLGDPERDQWIIDNPNAGNVDGIAASLAPLNPLAPAEAKQPTTPQWDWDESDLKVSA